ncbi:MAG: S41 family peptidase [Marinifilaceae bacterium]
MNRRKFPIILYLFFLPFFLSLLIVSCSKDDDLDLPGIESQSSVISEIDEIMKEWYLWNEDLPEINPNSFDSANEYFDKLLAPQDKWSFIDNLDELMAFLENGTYKGYGFALKWKDQEHLMVKLVYDASVLKTEGITRGWELIRINGKAPSSMNDDDIINELNRPGNSFVFKNSSGEQKELILSQTEMQQNTVLHQDVITTEKGAKVAYLVFDSFLDSSEQELNAAFSDFKTKGATELILDLRYNGGGSTKISNQLSALITGNTFTGQVYSKIFHNQSKSASDTIDLFLSQPAAYNFERIFIITTRSTASASEMVINGLEPYLGAENVILIGTQTHGKPVGMYVFEVPKFNLAVVPISFKITNKDDIGEYFDGIPVDFEIADDLTHDWGDQEETNLKAALNYIETGIFDQAMLLKAGAPKGRELPLKGFREMIGAF